MTEPPRIIFWETTKQCNLRCAYCRVLKNGPSSEFTTEEAFWLVSDIKGNFPDALLIFSGGEPLLRRDLFDILLYASSLRLKVSLATNGTLLGRREAAKLKKIGIGRVSISLDSSEEVYHDMSRGIQGSYRKALYAASVLKDEDVPLQINFTVARSNMHEIVDIAELSYSLGAEALHYFILVATGCGRELEEDEMLDAGQMDEVLRTVKRISRDFPMEIRPTCAPQYVRFVEGGENRGCHAGSRVFFISSEGDLYPCGYLPAKAGSIRKESIDDIWKNSPVFTALRRNELKGACSHCIYKEMCRGCRARAYSRTGDYLAGDESCLTVAR